MTRYNVKFHTPVDIFNEVSLEAAYTIVRAFC